MISPTPARAAIRAARRIAGAVEVTDEPLEVGEHLGTYRSSDGYVFTSTEGEISATATSTTVTSSQLSKPQAYRNTGHLRPEATSSPRSPIQKAGARSAAGCAITVTPIPHRIATFERSPELAFLRAAGPP
jgi:hypothetical protein